MRGDYPCPTPAVTQPQGSIAAPAKIPNETKTMSKKPARKMGQ